MPRILIVLATLVLPASLYAFSATPERLVQLSATTTELRGCENFGDKQLAVLTQFTKLEVLECWYLNLTNEGWKDVGKLKNLKRLKIGGGGANGGDFVHIGKLSQLEELEINCHTQCDDVEFEALLQLKELRRLRICGYAGSSVGIMGLAQLPKLEELTFVYPHQLRDEDLAAFSRIPTLRHLGLVRFEFLTDAGFTHLGKLTQLESLVLDAWDNRPTSWTHKRFNEWTGKGLRELAGLAGLRNLNLRGSSELNDEDMAFIVKLGSLEYLNVADCEGVSETGIAKLAALPRLKHLVAYGLNDEPRGDGMKSFGAQSALEVLEVPHTYRLNTAFFDAVALLPRLRVLNMEQCSRHEAGSLVALSKATSLRELVAYNLDVSSEELRAICELTALETLSYCARDLKDADMEPMAAIKGLQRLNLTGVENLGDSAMATIGKQTSLIGLKLVGSDTKPSKLTNNALTHLKNLSRLESIHFVWIRSIGETLAGLEDLTSTTSIRIDGCGNLGAEAMKRILALPKLRETWLHSVTAGVPDADFKASASIWCIRFEYAGEGVAASYEEWAKQFPLIHLSGN